MSTHRQLTAGTFESLQAGAVDSLQLSAVMPVAEVQRAALWQDAPTQAAALEQGKGVKVAIDLAAGTFGGIAQLIVGHPFDTIKVRCCSQDRGQHEKRLLPGLLLPLGPQCACYALSDRQPAATAERQLCNMLCLR
jgi:hypothetical protein